MEQLFIKWKDEYDLGIPIIDEQHRGIVSTINSFYYFIQTGSGAKALVPTLHALRHYTSIHFTTEEALFEATGFPTKRDHRDMHESLRAETEIITRGANKNLDPYSALDFLKRWWLGHIMKEDTKYAPYVLGNK